MSSVDGDNVADSKSFGDIGTDVSRSIRNNSSMEYAMNRPKRGIFLLINNKNFEKSTGMSERTGTDADGDNLIKTFRSLGFEIHPFYNLKAEEMADKMKQVAHLNHAECDCFAAAFLSHGDNEIIYGTDLNIKIEFLIEPIKHSQSLIGKPKMFFIQACRGDKLDTGKDMFLADAGNQLESVRIPLEADFLYAYSTVPGYYSWRNSTKGSWFVQALCNKLEEYKTQRINILTLLTRVNHQVAYEFESSASNPRMNRMKQIPSIVSMLTKDLYIMPK